MYVLSLAIGSSLIGSRPGMIETSLHLLLQVPHYIPEQKKFELGVLVSNFCYIPINSVINLISF